LSFRKGDLVYFIRGKRAGKVAKFEEKQSLGIFKRTYIAKLKMDKESIESDMKNLIAIGNGKEVNLA
jgi:ribosomal protein S4E